MSIVRRAWFLLVCAACASTPDRAAPKDQHPTFAGDTNPPAAAAAATSTSTPAPTPAPGPQPAAEPAKAPAIEMTFAGDVMFGRFKDWGFRAIPAEKHDPFTEVGSLIQSDHMLCNLETPVMHDPPRKSQYGTTMRFVTSPDRVKTLLDAGVDTVTIANNHYFDMHEKGAAETPKCLAELGLRAIGASRQEGPYFRVEDVDVKGWKVGFIAGATECNTDWDSAKYKSPWTERDKIGDALVPVIKAARADHDLVIVTVHWGKEYLDAPEKWQVRAAHKWIDAGADAVICHHPHVLQGIENYKGHIIAYSLGNFLFDNTTSNRKWGGVLRLQFTTATDGTSCVEKAAFHPTITVPEPTHHVTIATGKGFKTVANVLIRASKAKVMTKTAWAIDGDAVTTAGTCPQ